MAEKVIALIDMDCFYVQVESRENPALWGKPAAVVQYKDNGGIIALNYEARALGVTRQMYGNQARQKCPSIALVHVPEVREKADLTKYRKAGREVIEVLISFGAVVERASIDEAFVDLTSLVDKRLACCREVEVVEKDLSNTHIAGAMGDRKQVVTEWLSDLNSSMNEPDLRLAVGGAIVEEMRAAVFAKTQFRCSAGIAHCKTLAKLCCGVNKPNKQTLLPLSSLDAFFATIPITKVRGFGGKLGNMVTTVFNIQTMSQLSEISIRDLKQRLDEKTAQWIHGLCKGFDNETVTERGLVQSIGCGKNFLGPDMLDTKEKVELRVGHLVEEMVERLEIDKDENNRLARGFTIGAKLESQGFASRAGPLHSYDRDSIYRMAMGLLSKLRVGDANSAVWEPKLQNITISASKFENLSSTLGNTQSITNYFKKRNDSPTSQPLSAAPSSNAFESQKIPHNTTKMRQDNEAHDTSNSWRQLDSADILNDTVISSVNNACTLNNTRNFTQSEAVSPAQVVQQNTAHSPDTISSPDVKPVTPPKRESFFQRKMREMREEELRKKQEQEAAALEQERRLKLDNAVQPDTVPLSSIKPNTVSSPEVKPGSVPKREPFFQRKMREMREEELRQKQEQQAALERERKLRQIDESVSEHEQVSNYANSDVTETARASTSSTSGHDSEELDIAELIPNLENFDPEILNILPSKYRALAKERVEMLKKQPKKSSNEKFSIKGFLVDRTTTSSGPDDCTEVCEKCSKLVSAFEMPEHLDYHFAKELHQELKDSGQLSASPSPRASAHPHKSGAKSEKRKRVKSSAGSSSKKQQKDISAFFKKM